MTSRKLVLWLSIGFVCLAARAAAPTMMVTDGVSCLNFRGRPSVRSDVTDCLPPGSQLQILKLNRRGFSRVEAGGRTGYVWTAYLTSAEEGQPVVPPPAPAHAPAPPPRPSVNPRSTPPSPRRPTEPPAVAQLPVTRPPLAPSSFAERPPLAPTRRGDSLCTGERSKQTQKLSRLGGHSYCDVIYDTIARGCTYETSTQKLYSEEVQGLEDFCPGFRSATPTEKNLALMNLVASIVTSESGWDNSSTGDGGSSLGLLQLTTSTDRHHGCACGNLRNERNEEQNLRCGTQMIVSFMAKDRVVGTGSSDRNARGIARSFGPFRNGRSERSAIRGRLSAWCTASLKGVVNREMAATASR